MNSRNLQNYSLAATMLFAAGCGVAERHQATITRTWPAAAIHRVEVHEVDGAISVDAGSADTISLVADVRSRGVKPKPDMENQGFFETTVSGDTLIIGRKQHVTMRMPIFRMNDVTVDYTLHVPKSVALELRTVNGRVASRGVDGGCRVATVNGAVDVSSSGTNELVATTVNGPVRARFIDDFQGAQLKTVNGRVVAVLPPTASFATDFAQVNGDVEASFPLNIHSHPGSRRVSGEVNGGKHELRIVTVNGDIKVETGAVAPVAPAAPAAPAAPVAPASSASPSTR